MNDKISIILPIYNVGEYLREGLDSLINQSIGHENLEIIMVDDCSTDNCGEIIDEYCDKYDSCIAVHHEKNSGGPYTPRNTGLEVCTGDYIMFLDPDDRYELDACEVLYNKIKETGDDMVLARFRRIFESRSYVQKSYSPYPDNLSSYYPDEEFRIANPLDVSDELWENIVSKILYGRDLEITYSRDEALDEIRIDNLEEEPDLLKIPPSIWCKIYKRELIMDNNLTFPPFVVGEDLCFNLEAFLKAKGITFLNSYISCNYHVREVVEDNKSITNNINVRFMADLLDCLIYSRKCCDAFSRNVKNISINPHLFYWMNKWKSNSFKKEENEILLGKIYELKKIHHGDLKTNLLILSIITAVKSANIIK